MTEKSLTLLAIAGLIGTGWFAGILFAEGDTPFQTTLSVTTRPVTVPAHTKPSDIVNVRVTTIQSEGTIIAPENGWITGFNQTVNGAPEGALRYTWVYDASQRDPYCTDQQRVVFVMSFEKAPELPFTPGYGYYVTKGTELRVHAGFANFSDTDLPAASATIGLSFMPESSGKKLIDAYPLFLNAKCTSLFAVPPRTERFVKELDKPFTMPFDGRMVFLGSHAHKFATEILLTMNGKELWRTSPVHLQDGTNLGNPIYKTPYNGVPVKTGDVLNLRVIYSNPMDKPTDAMSSMYIQILPDQPLSGGHEH